MNNTAGPRDRSCQWCKVSTPIVAPKARSRNGSASATACTAAAAPRGRCDSITADGSAATTGRSLGSYDPLPAPTLSTGDASPRAAQSGAAILGTSCRPATVLAADPVVHGRLLCSHGLQVSSAGAP